MFFVYIYMLHVKLGLKRELKQTENLKKLQTNHQLYIKRKWVPIIVIFYLMKKWKMLNSTLPETLQGTLEKGLLVKRVA